MKIFMPELWGQVILNECKQFQDSNYWIPVFDPNDPAVKVAKKAMDAIEDKDSEQYKTAKLVYDAVVKAADSSNLFTQTQLDDFISANAVKLKESHQSTLNELKALKKRSDLTSAERVTLEKKIEDIQGTLKTAEQLATEASKKAEARHTKDLEDMTVRKDKWKGRYTNSTIDGQLRDASSHPEHKAYQPSQVLAILRPDTTLVEALDGKGKPTGELVPQVVFSDTDKDGKPITLKLSPVEAVKRMSEMPEHQNLFEGKGKGGPGLHRTTPAGKVDVAEVAKDAAAYRAGRKDGSIALE